MSYRHYLMMAVALLLLSGCATMNRDECLNADWYLIGYEDGSVGKLTEQIGEHRSACAEYAVVPQMEDYLAGHQRGIRSYCTLENGFRQGRSGRALNSVCQGELRSAFVAGHRQGYEIYRQAEVVKKWQKKLSTLKADQQSLRQERQTSETELLAEHTPTERRTKLYQRIRWIESELLRLSDRKLHLKHRLNDEQLYLEALERDWQG